MTLPSPPSPGAALAAAVVRAKLPVLLGVDDSPGAAVATDWAAAEAAARGVELRIVHAWCWQTAEPWPTAIDRRARSDLRRAGEAIVARSVRTAHRHDDLAISPLVIEGYPPDVL